MREHWTGITQEYIEIFERIAYAAHSHDLRGVEKNYWKLKHLVKRDTKQNKVPVIELD